MKLKRDPNFGRYRLMISKLVFICRLVATSDKVKATLSQRRVSDVVAPNKN